MNKIKNSNSDNNIKIINNNEDILNNNAFIKFLKVGQNFSYFEYQKTLFL